MGFRVQGLGFRVQGSGSGVSLGLKGFGVCLGFFPSMPSRQPQPVSAAGNRTKPSREMFTSGFKELCQFRGLSAGLKEFGIWVSEIYSLGYVGGFSTSDSKPTHARRRLKLRALGSALKRNTHPETPISLNTLMVRSPI